MNDVLDHSGVRSADADLSALFFVSLGGAGEIGLSISDHFRFQIVLREDKKPEILRCA